MGESPLNGKGLILTDNSEGLRNGLLSYESMSYCLCALFEDNMKKFDKEYSTQYTPEMKFLLGKGIKYTFVKEINGVTTYKYEKTPELFKFLEKFYSRK